MHLTYAHLDWRELLNRLAAEQTMDQWFQQLALAFDGDMDAAERWLMQLSQGQQERLGFDRGEFQDRLRKEGLVERGPDGKTRLSSRGEQRLRHSALEQVFGPLKRGARGEHGVRGLGRGEKNGEKRAWAAGDDVGDIAWQDSLLSSWRAGHAGLEESDLIVEGREANTACATVMAIDISHSMTLYGEDRITPAKQVALAWAELQQRRYPSDAFHILLFGDDVEEVTLADLPYISNGPFHTNTCEALARAAEILKRKQQPNKRIVMITDGKPTALFTHGRGKGRELLVNSSYGLDPQIVNATLNEAARLRRHGIDLSVFLVASDPYLERFVERLCAVSGGKAFRATLDSLGSQVLGQIGNRRRRR